jgi:hypothetical protein
VHCSCVHKDTRARRQAGRQAGNTHTRPSCQGCRGCSGKRPRGPAACPQHAGAADSAPQASPGSPSPLARSPPQSPACVPCRCR